jgi:hypothetical protein
MDMAAGMFLTLPMIYLPWFKLVTTYLAWSGYSAPYYYGSSFSSLWLDLFVLKAVVPNITMAEIIRRSCHFS